MVQNPRLTDFRPHIWALVILAIGTALASQLWAIPGLGILGCFVFHSHIGQDFGRFFRKTLKISLIAALMAGSVYLARQDITQAILIGAKITLLGSLGACLASGKTPSEMAANLAGLGLGRKLSSLLWLGTRAISDLRNTLNRRRQAMALRGFQLSKNPRRFRQSWTHLGWLVAFSLLHANAKAERLSAAMILRGWQGEIFQHFAPLSAQNWLKLGALILLCGALVFPWSF